MTRSEITKRTWTRNLQYPEFVKLIEVGKRIRKLQSELRLTYLTAGRIAARIDKLVEHKKIVQARWNVRKSHVGRWK